MNPTIYYMSGTGNSYYVARTIEESFECARLIDIGLLNNQDKVIESSDSIGFVFPCYCHDIPNPYKRFLKRLTIANKGVYTFAIVTHNGAPGDSLKHLAHFLSRKDQNLYYGKALHMPGNSVIVNNLVTPPKEQKIRLNRVNALLPAIISDIKNQTSSVEIIKEKLGGIIQGKVSKLALNYLYKLPKHFHADNTCINCGICEKACSFNNISLNDGKPSWDNRCEACLACFHLCPQQAINLDNYSKDFVRYKHPDVSLAELMRDKY